MRDVLVVVHVAGVALAEEHARIRTDLEIDEAAGRLVAGQVEADVGLPVAGQVILARAGEIDAVEGLADAVALAPADQVRQAEAFLAELDSPLAADAILWMSSGEDSSGFS